MMSIGRVALIYAGFVFLAIVQAAWYAPRLPKTVASHFGGSGLPNGWMARQLFVQVEVGTSVVIALVMLGVYALGALCSMEVMNLPNKPYWLAPERCETARHMIVSFALRFGILIQLFIQATFVLTAQANLQPQPRMSPSFWLCLAVYLGATFVLVIQMILRFMRTPRE
jgi:uncharacterized membrane protein